MLITLPRWFCRLPWIRERIFHPKIFLRHDPCLHVVRWGLAPDGQEWGFGLRFPALAVQNRKYESILHESAALRCQLHVPSRAAAHWVAITSAAEEIQPTPRLALAVDRARAHHGKHRCRTCGGGAISTGGVCYGGNAGTAPGPGTASPRNLRRNALKHAPGGLWAALLGMR